MAKHFITIQPRFTAGVSNILATVFIYTIHLCIISKLQWSFFCAAYSSRANLACNKGKSHESCGNVFVSHQKDLNGSRDLTGTQDNQCPKKCGYVMMIYI